MWSGCQEEKLISCNTFFLERDKLSQSDEILPIGEKCLAVNIVIFITEKHEYYLFQLLYSYMCNTLFSNPRITSIAAMVLRTSSSKQGIFLSSLTPRISLMIFLNLSLFLLTLGFGNSFVNGDILKK